MTSRLFSGDRHIDLSMVREHAARAATGFAAAGVGRGDTIALFLRNDFPFLEASVAAGLLGAYVVPINWHASAEEARYILEDSGAKLLICHADLAGGVLGAVPDRVGVIIVPTPDEIAAAYQIGPSPPGSEAGPHWAEWLQQFAPYDGPPEPSPGSMIYTSGTTGRPKGVRRAPRPEHDEAGLAISRAIFGLQGWDDRPEEIVLLLPGPLYHSAPNGWAMYFLGIGANIVLAPRFDPEQLLRDIERHRVTHLLAVPTMFVRLLKLSPEVRGRYDLSSLRYVMHGAAPCPPHVKRAMIDWLGPIIWEHYGSTEVGGLTICSSEEWLAHPGTVGRVMPNCTLRLLDETGADVPVGQPGDIVGWRAGYADFTYNRDDEKRRGAERRPGLIATGDVGFFDQDGFLYLSGRSSDMVISGGVNIYPAEIESALLQLEGVRDCAVFGIPDAEFGEQLCAVVEPEAGARIDIDDVRTFVRSRLAGFKVPRVVEFRDTLPREDSGKIFKRELRDPYWQDAGRQI
ncbi:long-chain acyl-CoA synthetase [Sphingomonas sp. OV641]|uniref:acyl-CoA synthetase n=1 Tax=Sphingomonas sp. OV641 TaxID=1881068 RepID=UPI0008D696B1|nr:acyl-CoA synthetase [Sphingomonas sp. OV641]SEJ66122.1 long-chain acyl-CoA synthetase [Sphingomonas sp. OV641]